jgi:hypothetical protein
MLFLNDTRSYSSLFLLFAFLLLILFTYFDIFIFLLFKVLLGLHVFTLIEQLCAHRHICDNSHRRQLFNILIIYSSLINFLLFSLNSIESLFFLDFFLFITYLMKGLLVGSFFIGHKCGNRSAIFCEPAANGPTF